MAGRPALQELPLQDAIASARDWNRALQQSAAARQAVAAQQAPLAQPQPHTVTPPPVEPQGRETRSLGAQHAQHDGALNSKAEVAASADAGQQHSSPTHAQHAQHAQHDGDSSSNNAAATHRQTADSGRPSSNHTEPPAAADAQAESSKKKKETSFPTSSSSSEASLGDQPNSISGQSPQPGDTYAQGDNSPQLADRRQQPGEPKSAPEQPQPPSSAQSQSHPGPQAQSQSESQQQQQQQQQPLTSPEERQHQQHQQREVSAEQKRHQQPQLPSAHQQQQQSVAQDNAPLEGQAPAVATALGMPPAFPAMDDLKCVLGSGEQMTMLDGLQGTLAGLAVKVLTGLVGSFFFIPVCHCSD